MYAKIASVNALTTIYEARTPAPIITEQQYDACIEILNHMVATAYGDDNHPFYPIIDTLSDLIGDYSDKYLSTENMSGEEVFRYDGSHL